MLRDFGVNATTETTGECGLRPRPSYVGQTDRPYRETFGGTGPRAGEPHARDNERSLTVGLRPEVRTARGRARGLEADEYLASCDVGRVAFHVRQVLGKPSGSGST
jgi:hypothetical protein